MSGFIVTFGGTRLRVKSMMISADCLSCDERLAIPQRIEFEVPMHMRYTRKGRKLLRHMMRNMTPMKLRRVKR